LIKEDHEFKASLATWQVLGQPELYSKTLSQKQTNKKSKYTGKMTKHLRSNVKTIISFKKILVWVGLGGEMQWYSTCLDPILAQNSWVSIPSTAKTKIILKMLFAWHKTFLLGSLNIKYPDSRNWSLDLRFKQWKGKS
jgi:hypothetical protein